MSEELPAVGEILIREFESVNVDDALTKVAGIFSEKDTPIVVVLDGSSEGRVYGILTERVLLRPHINMAEAKAKSFAIKAPKLTSSSSITEAARLMLENNLKALPVMEDGKPIGIVTVDRIAEAAQPVLQKTLVRDVMTKDPVTVKANDTIGKAISLMREMGISRLPVVERGALRGIVTVHDIVEKVIKPRERATRGETIGEKARTLSNKVSEIMSKPVITTSPREPVIRALQKMSSNDVSCLVVVDDGSVEGIITMMDVLEPIARLATKQERGISIQVSYKMEHVDFDDKDRVMAMAERFVKRFNESLGNGFLTLYFKEHKEKHGDMHLIHCRARLKTDKYQFVGTGEAWRADFAARAALERIERQFLLSRKLASKYPYADELLERLAESY